MSRKYRTLGTLQSSGHPCWYGDLANVRRVCIESSVTRSPVLSRTWLQLVRQFEKRLLIVNNVQVLNARSDLCTVDPNHLVA